MYTALYICCIYCIYFSCYLTLTTFSHDLYWNCLYHKSEENPHDAPIIPSPRLVPSASVFISHLLTLIQDDNEAECDVRVREYGSALKSPRWGNIMTDIITSPQLFRPSHSKHSPGGQGVENDNLKWTLLDSWKLEALPFLESVIA